MTREEQIQEAKDKAFPIPKEGRSYESAWAAGGFEMGADSGIDMDKVVYRGNVFTRPEDLE